MVEKSHLPKRDPQNVQAYLIGSGIASLAAAVHLIEDAKVPGPKIHILDVHQGTGGGMKTFGDPVKGYFLPFECHPFFHGSCTERLLSLVPSKTEPEKSLMDAIKRFEQSERPQPQDFAFTRSLKKGETQPEIVYTKGIQVGLKHRMELIKLMLETERMLGSKRIEELFDAPFFKTGFWKLWSTTFALQPWHSAVEFQRHLRKYLEDIQTLNNIKTMNRTEYNLYESVTVPITTYLKQEGVDFRFNAKVTNLRTYPDSDPTTVSEIELTEDGSEHLITVDPVDIVVVTLGATGSGAVFGTNEDPPPALASNWEDLLIGDWGLWEKLHQKSRKFGSPTNFLCRNLESTVETFTTTFKGAQFMELCEKLTRDRAGTAALLSFIDSSWSITLSIPHQPLFPDQPDDVNVICGYALNPSTEGNYVKKAMYECSGEEILTEVLSHLNFPVETILPTAKTVPCGMPLGTSPFLTRGSHDRPHVIPHDTTNIACVGQFAEIPDDTTLSMEYSVRGAQQAVFELMGLPEKPSKIKKNLLLEVFDLMI